MKLKFMLTIRMIMSYLSHPTSCDTAWIRDWIKKGIDKILFWLSKGVKL